MRTFCPIFQGYPSSGCDVNCGDRLRQVCAGRVQHRGDTATWCTDLLDAHLRAARIDGIDTILPDATVIESAFLVTLPCARPGEEPQRQVGHLDTLPDHLAEPDVLPSGVVMIAPLDYDTVVWVVPMHELAALGRLPYREEFLDLAIPVTVKLGFKLYMRLEMVHGGGSSVGHRTHCLLVPSHTRAPGSSYSYTNTFFLVKRPSARRRPSLQCTSDGSPLAAGSDKRGEALTAGEHSHAVASDPTADALVRARRLLYRQNRSSGSAGKLPVGATADALVRARRLLDRQNRSKLPVGVKKRRRSSDGACARVQARDSAPALTDNKATALALWKTLLKAIGERESQLEQRRTRGHVSAQDGRSAPLDPQSRHVGAMPSACYARVSDD